MPYWDRFLMKRKHPCNTEMGQSNRKVLQFWDKFSVMGQSNRTIVSSCPFFDQNQGMVLSILMPAAPAMEREKVGG